jgi:H+/Cl- antiporter ClcA
MNIRAILIGAGLYLVGQLLIYYQLNGQFLWDSFKRNPWIVSLLGLPISYIFIVATNYAVEGFGGSMWPNRFMGFTTGILVYAWGTSFYFNQPIDIKTAVSLTLAVLIICIQVFWK